MRGFNVRWTSAKEKGGSGKNKKALGKNFRKIEQTTSTRVGLNANGKKKGIRDSP